MRIPAKPPRCSSRYLVPRRSSPSERTRGQSRRSRAAAHGADEVRCPCSPSPRCRRRTRPATRAPEHRPPDQWMSGVLMRPRCRSSWRHSSATPATAGVHVLQIADALHSVRFGSRQSVSRPPPALTRERRSSRPCRPACTAMVGVRVVLVVDRAVVGLLLPRGAGLRVGDRWSPLST